MSLSAYQTYIGTTRRLDGYERGGWPEAQVRVSYRDANGNQQVVTICADGARLLAKALKHNADFIDPPKPRRRSS